MQKLRKCLMLASILAGVSKHYAHALIGNVGNSNFRQRFL